MGCSSSAPEDMIDSPQELSTETDTHTPEKSPPPQQHAAHNEEHEDHDTIQQDSDSETREKVYEEEIVHEKEVVVVEEQSEVLNNGEQLNDFSVPNDPSCVYQYIYEYERHQPDELGWGSTSAHLLPSDRGKYSNEAATLFSRDSIRQVVDSSMRQWELRQCEEIWEEFEYAFDFQHCDWHEKQRQNSHVRRKLKRIQLRNPEVVATSLTAQGTEGGEARVPVLPAEALPPPLMRGWISKEGGAVLRSFNNRYFVLESTSTSSTLTYYLKKAVAGATGGGGGAGGDGSGGDEGAAEVEVGPPYGSGERGKIDLKGAVLTRSMQYTTLASAFRKQKYLLDLKSCSEGEAWIHALQEHIAYANRYDHVHQQQQQQQQLTTSYFPNSPVVATALSSNDRSHDSYSSPHPATSPSSPPPSPSSLDTVFIDISTAYQYIYLYERWQPLMEWGSSYPGHLLPTDKGKFSNRAATAFSQTMNSVVISPLPKDWFPLTEFRPDAEVHCDENYQWEYSFNFQNFKWHDYQQRNSCVRRKLLKRKIGDIHDPSNGLVSPRSRADKAVWMTPPPLMRGWISKEGGAVRKSFNNRYFVLESTSTSSTLTYYLKKAATGAGDGSGERGKIDLKAGVFTQGTAHSSVASANTKQKYLLDLKSCSEGEAWIHALQEHIAYAHHLQAITDRVRDGEDAMCSFKEMGA